MNPRRDPEPNAVEVRVEPGDVGTRLDLLLSRKELGFSRAALQRWIKQGRVTVGGQPVGPRQRLAAGTVVRIEPAPPEPSEALPQELPLRILHEDEHLIVVDKAAGMVVHPAPGNRDGTLVNALLHHRPTFVAGQQGGDPLRPGIVHRLDKDTSGVMVVARSERAREGLMERFRTHDLERRYRALVSAAPRLESESFDTLHGRHPVDRKRYTSRVSRGRRAVTHLRCLERFAVGALVTCTLETGRTHQIRVHLAEHGYPIVADPVYGGTPRDPRLKAAAQAIGRQALHAELLAFRHPITGAPQRFESPAPPDFERALAMLRRV